MTLENSTEEINDFLSEEPAADVTPPADGAEAAPPADTPVVDNAEPAPAAADPAPAVPPADVTPPAAAVEPPVTPAPVVDDREELINTLNAQINDLSSRIIAQPVAAEPKAPASDATPIVPEGQALEFVKDNAAFDEVMKSPENFNRLLTSVMNKSVETVLRSVPQLVVRLADQQITTRSAINEFYTNNKDLIPSKPFVGVVANDLAAKHPDWDLPKLLGELSTEVRSRLKLVMAASGGAPAPGATAPAPGAGAPAFAGAGGSGKGALDRRTTLQKDVDDLIAEG